MDRPMRPRSESLFDSMYVQGSEVQFLPAEAVARAESGRAGWSAAEILRVAGEVILREAAQESVEVAEATFRRSLEVARRQNALSCELRTATSFARLWRDQRRICAASELLATVRDRFGEGFQTRDCLRADALLKELRAWQDTERHESMAPVA
jgi:predicted ATPase